MFNDAGYSRRYTKTFTLTVIEELADIEEFVMEEVVEVKEVKKEAPPKKLDPNVKVYYPQEQEELFLRLDPVVQEYDPERPIPYIADLTPTGYLTIGWDSKMVPP